MGDRVVIAGGGLVGSLLAVMMRGRGHEVAILEKRADPRKSSQDLGRSINLVLTSRGLNALENVGLLKEALEISVPVTGRMMHSKAGELTYQAYGRDESECNYSISRLELNKFLLSAAEKKGVSLYFESSVDSIDFDQKVVAFGKDKKNILQYDILFGADGAGSKVRQILQGVSSDFKVETDFLSSGYKELFLPANSFGQPLLEKNALHIWPRGSHMLMALANLDNSFTMTLYMPHEEKDLSFKSIQGASMIERFLGEEFPDALSLMPNALKDYQQNPVGHLGTVRAQPWAFGSSVALIGDAAHAIVPFFGQGMNCGFEDCVYLNMFLNESDGHWQKALNDYDYFQRPNANAIADMALENFLEMQDKVADSNFLLKKKVEALLEKEFPNEYRSRYGMVTYTLIPYVACQAIGVIQSKILRSLCENVKRPEDVNLSLAKKLIDSELVPFYQKHSISLKRYYFTH